MKSEDQKKFIANRRTTCLFCGRQLTVYKLLYCTSKCAWQYNGAYKTYGNAKPTKEKQKNRSEGGLISSYEINEGTPT